MAECSSQGGHGLPSFFMLGCGALLGQPKTFSDPFAGACGLWRAWQPEKLVGEMFAVSMSWEDKAWSENLPLRT